MTDADEALLYAREHWATISEEDGFPEVAEAYRRGVNDEVLATDALFYRAGAAASADREEELEARVAELELFVKRIAHRWVPKRMTVGLLRANCWAERIDAAALLKESDQ